MLPTMEQADGWVERHSFRCAKTQQGELWRSTHRLYNREVFEGRALMAKELAWWLGGACALLAAQNKRIILTDYPAQEVPWHVLGMQLTLAACVGEVGPACGELLKWCDKNNVPLCEAMEGL